MEHRFEGKVVLITGAAGGIGQAAAKRFGSEGARVVAVDLPGPGIDETVQLARGAGATDALGVAADVSRADHVQAYVRSAVDAYGRIDAFFNNAGIEGWLGSSVDYPEETFDRVIAVNLKGVWLGMKYVVPVMRRNGGGAIVNTASVAGLSGTPGLIAYGASKHAVVGMTRTAALEFARDGVRVNAVCPGAVETRMMRAIERGRNPDSPEEVHAQTAAANPMGRYAEPDEVAALVAFLCSDDAGFINGGMYTIDGGSRAR